MRSQRKNFLSASIFSTMGSSASVSPAMVTIDGLLMTATWTRAPWSPMYSRASAGEMPTAAMRPLPPVVSCRRERCTMTLTASSSE